MPQKYLALLNLGCYCINQNNMKRDDYLTNKQNHVLPTGNSSPSSLDNRTLLLVKLRPKLFIIININISIPIILNCFIPICISFYRSNPPEVFLGKFVLKVCSKLTGEHPCRSVILIKLLCKLLFSKNISGGLLLFLHEDQIIFLFTLLNFISPLTHIRSIR